MKLIADNLIDFARYEKQASAEAAHVRPASAWREKVVDRFRHGQEPVGALLPWRSTHSRLRFRAGEVTLWAGINGHGKSLVTSNVALGFAAQGERVCIASMEMRPEATMHRMTRQAIGKAFPSESIVSDFSAWTDGRVWLYDQTGTVKWPRMIALGRYCAAELGVRHLFIDSLMKCGIGVDDYNAQKKFIDELCALAKDSNVHAHLIAHARKGEREDQEIDKFDVKGASEITDQVDNVILVMRNKTKERKREQNAQDADLDRQPDAILRCAKQRNGEWEGRIPLYLDRQSASFNEYKVAARDWVGLSYDFEQSRAAPREPGSDDE